MPRRPVSTAALPGRRAQREAAALAENMGSHGDRQAAAFGDASGDRKVFVVTGGFLPLNDPDAAVRERILWGLLRDQVPLDMELSAEVARPLGRLGERVTCAPIITSSGNTVGQACLALDAHVWIATIDLVPDGQFDAALIDTVREAIRPR